jgi:hypothetical protein
MLRLHRREVKRLVQILEVKADPQLSQELTA